MKGKALQADSETKLVCKGTRSSNYIFFIFHSVTEVEYLDRWPDPFFSRGSCFRKSISVGGGENSGPVSYFCSFSLSLFCERRRKKEGRGRAREKTTDVCSPSVSGRFQLFSEAAEKSKCLPAFLFGRRWVR